MLKLFKQCKYLVFLVYYIDVVDKGVTFLAHPVHVDAGGYMLLLIRFFCIKMSLANSGLKL